MPPAQAASALGTVAAWRGTVLNHEHPILETEVPLDGSRFEGIVAPVVRRPVFAIRLRPRRIFSLAEYETGGILTDKEDPLNRLRRRGDFASAVRGLQHIDIIRAAVSAKKNILVVGSTGSGKTTLVNAILDGLATLTPDDRVISIEDTTELQCSVKNYLDLRAVGSVGMLDCLRACMRLKPTRIVVGEVRGAEAHTLLKAWNTGHPGGAATVHANDAVSGLIRLESLVAEATSAPQQNLIAEAVDLVVFVDEETAGPAGRKVREVLLVTGYSNGNMRSACLKANAALNGRKQCIYSSFTFRAWPPGLQLDRHDVGVRHDRACRGRWDSRVGKADDHDCDIVNRPSRVRYRSDRHRHCRRCDAVGRRTDGVRPAGVHDRPGSLGPGLRRTHARQRFRCQRGCRVALCRNRTGHAK
jgi:type IV secretion system protein VirB11